MAVARGVVFALDYDAVVVAVVAVDEEGEELWSDVSMRLGVCVT